MASESLSKRFCKCIKKVRKTIRLRPSQRRGGNEAKEQAAIAVCVKSVLQTKGKTLRRFKCGRKPRIQTQKMKKHLFRSFKKYIG
jgi:hypothetical protein